MLRQLQITPRACPSAEEFARGARSKTDERSAGSMAHASPGSRSPTARGRVRKTASPHEFSSRRDEMFMARDGLKIFSPLGSGHFREAMLLLLHRAMNIPLLRSGL